MTLHEIYIGHVMACPPKTAIALTASAYAPITSPLTSWSWSPLWPRF